MTIQPRLNDLNGLVTMPIVRVRIVLMAVLNRLLSMRVSVTDARPHRFGMLVLMMFIVCASESWVVASWRSVR